MHTWRTLFILITSYIPRVNYKHNASVRFVAACYIVTNPWMVVNNDTTVDTVYPPRMTNTLHHVGWILSACPSIHNNTRPNYTTILAVVLPQNNNSCRAATTAQQYSQCCHHCNRCQRVLLCNSITMLNTQYQVVGSLRPMLTADNKRVLILRSTHVSRFFERVSQQAEPSACC